MEALRLWHGGVPDLKIGDLIEPGHDRRAVDGCKFCEARAIEAAGGPRPKIDGLSLHRDRVYVTTDREYARYHASLWGYGDLYRVTPIGPMERSIEDSFETYSVHAATVHAVYDRAVLLTTRQRRALHRQWETADMARSLGQTPSKWAT